MYGLPSLRIANNLHGLRKQVDAADSKFYCAQAVLPSGRNRILIFQAKLVIILSNKRSLKNLLMAIVVPAIYPTA